jgi:hypothetical protein
MDSELGTQASLAVLVSFAMQRLKASKYFPWLSGETERLNRVVALVIAFLSGFGIFVVWDHHGTLTISGLTAANLFHAATHGIEQWAFQQTAYRTVIAPPLPGALQPPLSDSKNKDDQFSKLS